MGTRKTPAHTGAEMYEVEKRFEPSLLTWREFRRRIFGAAGRVGGSAHPFSGEREENFRVSAIGVPILATRIFIFFCKGFERHSRRFGMSPARARSTWARAQFDHSIQSRHRIGRWLSRYGRQLPRRRGPHWRIGREGRKRLQHLGQVFSEFGGKHGRVFRVAHFSRR